MLEPQRLVFSRRGSNEPWTHRGWPLKQTTHNTESPFLDLHVSIANGFVSSKISDKCDDFDFDIVNFPFLDADIPRNLLGLLESVIMLRTSMREINV